MDRVTLRPLGPEVPAEPTSLVSLHLGAWSERVPVVHHRDQGVLYLPPDLLCRLPLRPEQQVWLWQAPSGTDLHLGPLVGIIMERTDPLTLDDFTACRLRFLDQGARDAGTPLVFFSIHDLDLQTRTVYGFHATEGGWRRCTAPLPDVLYNRGTYPNLKARAEAKAVRRLLRRALEIPFVNSVSALSKWETAQAIQFFAETRELVPATAPLSGEAALAAFLQRHPQAYAKSIYGSHGEDVLRITGPPFPGGRYHVRGLVRGRHREAFFSSVGSLYHDLKRWCRGEWVLQAGVDLATVQERPFDLRVVMQKDENGQWQFPSLVVRWAAPGSVVTNTSQGAAYVPLPRFLRLFGVQIPGADRLEARVKGIALRAALALEARYGLLGELGLDVAVDRAGRLWVLEANSKPFMDPGEGSYLPFCYARYLAIRNWRARYAAAACGPLQPVLQSHETWVLPQAVLTEPLST